MDGKMGMADVCWGWMDDGVDEWCERMNGWMEGLD